MYNLFNDKEICDKEGWKYWNSFDDFEKQINDNITYYNSKSVYDWIIFIKDNETPIGIISVHTKHEEDYSCEIGYSIHPTYHGKGYCTEALITVSKFLINKVGFYRLVCKYRNNNIASKKVLEKSSYKYEGTERCARYRKGKFLDVHVYSLLKIDL
ncbi:MAG: GNAT family N-acetyltransferase [Bacilli bacterium]|nr:GNAT family N-acetyltransferase [Bacilli bacterium]